MNSVQGDHGGLRLVVVDFKMLARLGRGQNM